MALINGTHTCVYCGKDFKWYYTIRENIESTHIFLLNAFQKMLLMQRYDIAMKQGNKNCKPDVNIVISLISLMKIWTFKTFLSSNGI